jgi:hypothetical protein
MIHTGVGWPGDLIRGVGRASFDALGMVSSATGERCFARNNATKDAICPKKR